MDNDQKRDFLMDKLTDVLGQDRKYFDLEYQGPISDSCDDRFSILVGITPNRNLVIEDGQVDGAEQCIEICLDDEDHEVFMLVGEGSEQELCLQNIYSYLYWGEVAKET